MMMKAQKYITGILTAAILMLAAPAAYAQDITTGLISHWTLNETSGSSIADSVGSNTGVWTDGSGNSVAEETTAGQIGSALDFDGVDDEINANNDPSLNDIVVKTISAWIRIDATVPAPYVEIATKDAGCGSTTSWYFHVDDTMTLDYDQCFSGNNGNWSTTETLTVGQWHHVAVVYDRSSLTNDPAFYIDGQLATTNENNTPTGSTNSDAGADLIIGDDNSSNNFNGAMDDVRIYGRALTAADINALYLGGPGAIIYNTNNNVMQYHDGTQWIAMGKERYVPNAVNFDDVNDYLTSGSALTGVVDGKTGTVSLWFKYNSGLAVDDLIFGQDLSRGLSVRANAADEIQIFGKLDDNTVILDMKSSAYVDDQWHHLLASWDLTDPAKRHIYIDGVSDLAAVTTYIDDFIDYTRPDSAVGSFPAGPGAAFNGDLADVYILFNTYIDLSVAANRAKFYNGGPVNLGADGSGPTGTAPDIFLSGDTANWSTNKGTGGGFTENGTLTDALTKPGGLTYDPLFPFVKLLLNFDDATSGTVTTDSSNSAHTVTSVSGASLSNAVATRYGQAVADTGNNEYWQVTGSMDDFNLDTAHTIDFWVYYSVITGYREVFSFLKTGAPTARAEFGIQPGAGGSFYSTWGEWTGMGTPTANTWYHYAFVYDGVDTRLYIDGVDQGPPTNPHFLGNNVYAGVVFESLNIGIGVDGTPAIDTSLDFVGYIDDFRYTQGVRYTGNFTPPQQTKPGGVYCSNPTEFIGSMIYNTTSDQMQFCNGVEWIAMGPTGDGGGGCSNPTGTAGSLTYNTVFNKMQYCEGDTWIGIGGDGVASSLLSGLVGHWPLDETTGSSIADVSGSGYTGTWTDGTGNSVAEETTTGVVNNALDFDGTDDIIDIGSVSEVLGSSQMTLSAWLKRDATGDNAHVWNGTDPTQASFGLGFFQDGNLWAGVHDGVGGTNKHARYALDDTAWHHVVMVFDGTQATDATRLVVYVDNAPVTLTYNDTVPSTVHSDAGRNLRIGRYWNTFFSDGKIDDVRLYNRALSASEVSALYSSNLTLASGLMGYWRMDESSGTTVADSSGNGNNGTSDDATPTWLPTGGVVSGTLDIDSDETVSAGTWDVSGTGITMAGWVYLRTNTKDGRIICKTSGYTDSDSDWCFFLDDGTDEFELRLTTINGYQTNRTTSVDYLANYANEWHHIAVTYNAATDAIVYYIDGVQIDTDTHGPGGAVTTGSGETVALGNNSVGGAREWDGRLDELRVYDRPLSASEIAALYNQVDCPSVGDTCSDDTIYAGLSPDGNVRMYAPQCNIGETWNGSSCTGSPSNVLWNENVAHTNYTTTGATSTSDGDGNTATIITVDADSVVAGTQTHNAAQACADLNVHGHTDWYLPARTELELLYTNRVAIGNFTTDDYWTSTETAIHASTKVNFATGTTSVFATKNTGEDVRCVRK